MATLTITIADEHLPRVLEAVCASGTLIFAQGGEPRPPDLDETVTTLGDWIVQCVAAYESLMHMQSFVPDTDGIVLR